VAAATTARIIEEIRGQAKATEEERRLVERRWRREKRTSEERRGTGEATMKKDGRLKGDGEERRGLAKKEEDKRRLKKLKDLVHR